MSSWKLRSSVDASLIETSLKELHEVFDALEVDIFVFKFSLLESDGQSLQQHVKRLLMVPGFFDSGIGPSSDTALIYKTPLNSFAELKSMSVEQAAKWLCGSWRNVTAFKKEWKTMVKSISLGINSPLVSRGIHFGSPGKYESYGAVRFYWPVPLKEPDGSRWWGMIAQRQNMTDQDRLELSLPDILTVKHTSSFISVVDILHGCMLWQNPASVDLYGSHGKLNSQLLPSHDSSGSNLNLIELLLGPSEDGSQYPQIRAVVEKGGTFRATIEVTHPLLRSLIDINDGEEMHLETLITQTCDPHSLQKVYVLSQIDVTRTVVSQRELERTRLRLEREKVKSDNLILRQRELIVCLSWVGSVGSSAGGNARVRELIDSVRRQLTNSIDEDRSIDRPSSSVHKSPAELEDSLEIEEFIGSGSFGQVFKGRWRGIPVAVKSMVIPISGAEKKERMALMEAAVSSSLVHPNIIKTHTYSIKPVRSHHTGSSSTLLSVPLDTNSFPGLQAPISAFEVKIVLEYCNKGSLLDALKDLTFHPGSMPDYPAILEVALAIAKGMQHLHSCNIIHADLKPSNVLLQSVPDQPNGVTAKISDFGLSIAKIDAQETHVSGFYQGTASYSSPECLVTGKQSNAGDVYSFAIILYELFSCSKAYSDVPLTFLGHKVSQEHLRPSFPPGTPPGYRQLAEACWDPSACLRPTFEAIITTLTLLKESALDAPDLPATPDAESSKNDTLQPSPDQPLLDDVAKEAIPA